MFMTRMVLIRTSNRPANLDILNRTYENVELHTNFETIWKINNFVELIPTFAKIKLSSSPLDANLNWEVPEGERKKCEEVLEYAAAMLSICNKSKLQIFSAFGPSLLFTPETKEEHVSLLSNRGYHDSQARLITTSAPPLTNFDWNKTFSDRVSGAFLMKDALAHETASGKFRDYMRLFENAFGLSTKEFPKKLNQFLYPQYGYSRSEIQEWVSIRDPLSHADNKKNQIICYEGDITNYIDRVEQAAYDVIFNKLHWSSNSYERRNVWLPGAYSTNQNGNGVLQIGSPFNIALRDRFNVYPIYIRNNFSPFPYNGVTDCPIAEKYEPIRCSVDGIDCPLRQ